MEFCNGYRRVLISTTVQISIHLPSLSGDGLLYGGSEILIREEVLPSSFSFEIMPSLCDFCKILRALDDGAIC